MKTFLIVLKTFAIASIVEKQKRISSNVCNCQKIRFIITTENSQKFYKIIIFIEFFDYFFITLNKISNDRF